MRGGPLVRHIDLAPDRQGGNGVSMSKYKAVKPGRLGKIIGAPTSKDASGGTQGMPLALKAASFSSHNRKVVLTLPKLKCLEKPEDADAPENEV